MENEKRNAIEANYAEFYKKYFENDNYLKTLQDQFQQSSDSDKFAILRKISHVKNILLNLTVEEMNFLKSKLDSFSNCMSSSQVVFLRRDARRFDDSEKIQAYQLYKKGVPIYEIRDAIGAFSEFTARSVVRLGKKLSEKSNAANL